MDAKMKAGVEHVYKLIKKAAEADDAPKAVCYSQAAQNAAKALRELVDIPDKAQG